MRRIRHSKFKIQNSKFDSGFALVTALSLMAFMLVLVVTLLSLMEVETRSADNNLELQRAREGARLAFGMAIGKLQESAGNDQRVTARAEILGVDSGGNNRFKDEARFWTGVWQSTGSSTGWPKWLVSWHTPNSDPDPNSLPAESVLMLLAGPGSGIADDDNYVYAPKIDIRDKNGNVTSRIAWWVGDEGMKASVAQLPLNERPTTSPNFVLNTSKNALETMLATSHGLERVFNNYDRFTSVEAAKIDLFSSVDDLVTQTSFAANPNFDYVDGVTITEEIFHTLTPMSYGLLASTEPGIGLMQDLSLNSNLLGTEFGDYLNRGFTSAATRTGSVGSLAAMREFIPMRGIEATGGLVNGDVASLSAPVLTNFMLAFALFYENAVAPNPRLRVHFFSEFWNPYTSGFQMSDGVNEYELELRITGLPNVTINASPSGGASGQINLQTILGGPVGEPPTIRLKYDFDPTTFEAWYPGMTKNWTGFSNSSYPYESSETQLKTWAEDGNTLGGSNGIPLTVGGPNPETPGDTLTVTGAGVNPTDDIGVDVYLINLTTGGETLLTQINGLQYNRVTAPIDSTNLTNATFGYQFILRGPRFGDLDPDFGRGLWLSATDPRNPTNSVIYAQTTNGLGPAAVPTAPELLDLNPATQIERPLRLFNRSGTDGDIDDHYRLWQESPLFELPRERILSLASLQHLYFHNERPFKVGNSWGDEGVVDTQQWFDRFFFSGLSPDDSLSSFTQRDGFPNPILITYVSPDPTDFDDSPESVAQNAFVSGRFNLNSTSVSAWKTLLGGLRISGWPYVDYYPGNNSSDVRTVPQEINTSDLENRSNLFARFSTSLHETYDVAFTTPNTAAPSEYYRRGVRYLTSPQVEDLAVNMVRQIRERGEPFLTMKDFLNNPDATTGSVIEEAIQESVFTDSTSGRQEWDRSWETEGTGEDDDSDKIDIDHFSPGFLTQADIMTAIGPMLAPRSDTFKIRARCQTFSPFDSTEVIGDATIEAFVQRVPDKLDDSDDINNSIDRKFKIVSVRWLTEGEI